MYACLVIIWPVGMVLLWRNKEKYTNWKKIAIATLAVFMIINVTSSNMEKSKPKNVEPTVTQEKSVTPVENVKNSTVVSDKQANDIAYALSSVGINPSCKIEHMADHDTDTEKMYKLDTEKGKAFLYLSLDGTIISIRYNTHNLYKDGQVLNKIDDYYISQQEQGELIVKSANAIKQALEPKKSDVKMETWSVMKDPEQGIIASGYVDTKNNFNADIRIKVTIIWSMDGKSIKSSNIEN